MSIGAASMEAKAAEFRDQYNKLKNEVSKVIVGHDEIVHGAQYTV